MSNNKCLGIAAASFVAGSVMTWTLLTRRQGSDRARAAAEINNQQRKAEDEPCPHEELPAEIRAEQLSRNELYFGEEGMAKIKKASVAIVGLGGVGSHSAHMLARGGVGYLRLIDFDQVTLSSLNRHACATLQDVGLPKVAALQSFLRKICPDAGMLRVDARPQMYTGLPEKDGSLMACPDGVPGWDVVIDAIDDVPTKARLLAHCVRHKIPVISCMGAGGKSDVTRLHISSLRTACKDPLATKLRQSLRKILKHDPAVPDESFLDDMDVISVLYSSEKPVVKLADFTQHQKDQGVHNFGAVDNMRIRVMPVLGTMPAIMGQSLAAMTLCGLAGKPFSPLSGERIGRNVRNRLFQHLKNRERGLRNDLEQLNGINTDVTNKNPDWQRHEAVRPPTIINGAWVGPPQIDADDVEYIFSEVWRNRCAVTKESLGTVLEIARWDMTKPSNCQNLVLLGAKAMKKFDDAIRSTGDGRSSVPKHDQERIQNRLDSCLPDSRA